jgi:hypothetical protein
MNMLEMTGWAAGLGFLAGIRLYATVLALGVAIRTGWITLRPEFQHLDVLANGWVMAAVGAVFAIEFLADKIPWIDTLWDAVHTFIRPVAAGVIAVAALGELSPGTQTLLGLLTGGVALTSHSVKAATRWAVNHSPEPFSNIGLSLAGDLLVPAGVWFVTHHPVLALGIVAVFLAAFTIVARKVFRAVRSLLRSAVSGGDERGGKPRSAYSPSAAR